MSNLSRRKEVKRTGDNGTSDNNKNANKNNNGHPQERKKNKKVDKVQCDGRL
jgi:hypothetical protein